MMDETHDDNDDRGQVGIGTLIVFIAMVLVAAIAAGVLINTAGFLQSSAEETGEESSSQVTDRLQVTHSVGVDDHTNSDSGSANGELDTVEMTVTKSPGAEDIDLMEASLRLVGPQGTETLTSGNLDFQDMSGSSATDPVLSDSQNELKVLVDFSESPASDVVSGGDGIAEGEDVEVQLTADAGGSTTVFLSAPENINNGEAVIL